ncbi:MAG: ATP-binding protein [Planctomycetes bacterium]|nr:ATP-binding protein [Planctomycetota bacterium]
MCGDADAIRRLIINLVTNAAKHTKHGSIRIDIEEILQQDDRSIKLAVSDTGEGIPQEIIKKLGQAFALNAGMVGADYVKGSGLGLTICKGIAAAHGGSITVDSTPEKGATFTVILKADLAEPEKIKSDTQITQEATP